jgi:lipopolysaccharide export system protein LptC
MRLEGNAMAAGAGSGDRAAHVEARRGTRRGGGSAPTDRDRLFAAAKRRSVRVRLLRGAILVSVAGALVTMVAVAFFNPFGRTPGSLSFSNLTVDGNKIAMSRPRLAGFRSDGEPYVLTAERALQDMKHPTVAELQNLAGDMGMAGGQTTRLTADAGLYDSVAERMKLTGNVHIANTRFEVVLRSVDIDFKTGVYRSDEPVLVHIGGDTSVTADRATAQNNGQELIFEGRVRTTVTPQAAAPAEGKTKGKTQ